LSCAEYGGLRESILKEGCRDTIVTWNGYIVDGHNRYQICKDHNVSFKTEAIELEDETAAKCWMIDNQMARRNISDAAKIRLQMKKHGFLSEQAEQRMFAGKKIDPEVNLPQGKRAPQVRDIVAKGAGVSGKTVDKFNYIEKHAPKLADDLCAGKTVKNKRLSIDGIHKDLKAEERKASIKQTFSNKRPSETESYRIIHADIAELKSHIEPNSIDAIITDPPYPEEYIPLFDRLGEFASYALKEGAPCVVMTGQAYLGEYINLLSKSLQYHWTLAYVLPGATAQIWGRRVGNTWKPVLLFSKGRFDWTFFQDSVVSPGPSKEHHEWGQSVGGFQQLVQRFSVEGGLVCDPFCGAGTTGLACLQEGRNFIGSDIDEESISKTKYRLHQLEEENAPRRKDA